MYLCHVLYVYIYIIIIILYYIFVCILLWYYYLYALYLIFVLLICFIIIIIIIINLSNCPKNPKSNCKPNIKPQSKSHFLNLIGPTEAQSVRPKPFSPINLNSYLNQLNPNSNKPQKPNYHPKT